MSMDLLVSMRSLFTSLNPMRCVDVYREETDFIKTGQELMTAAHRELDGATSSSHLPEIAAAKQTAQLSLDFAAKALTELQ